MNLLNALKLTALMTAGTAYGAFAQQKPQKDDVKSKTEFTPIKSDSTYDHKVDKLGRKIWEQWVKDEESEKKTSSGRKVEVPAAPNLPALPGERKVDPLRTPQEIFDERFSKQTLEERKKEAELMKDPKKLAEMRAGLRKKLAKAEADHNKEEIAVLKARNDELEEYIELVLQDNQMLRDQLKVMTDSLHNVENRKQLTVVTNNYIYSDSSKVKVAPWEFSTGPTHLWIAGPKADPNRDQLGPIDDHYNIVQTPVNGWFVDVTSPDFDAEGFLSLLSTEFYVAIFNGVELPELVSIGDTDNSGLYEYTVDGSKLLTYGQASLNMGKEFRAGMFGFEPKLNLGVHYQDVPELKMKDNSVKTDRWTEQAMEANRFSAFGKASFRIAFYPWEEKRLIEADKEKNAKRKADKQLPDKEKTRALVIYLGINAFDTTQKPVQANPYSGVGPFNGKDQFFWHVDLGLAYKF
jgi:hypothetical protein